ncbi:uncharacterized protein N7498_003937 [Penicillium cinerascens]|uniref:Non-homologous end-joining factor 1 n=1 Tax=Penicillium cinerascens TaxID=70096 RepID=A0A9W9N314_9EURO|nr:uncharacterized protein N7498_003937 [Penicillium cinerascens]KAJ5212291.1 hypothetical protein N7498_003937 [Penicillium cinerascens]
MSSEWCRLHLAGGLPPLLFQYSWTRKGYELYVTDLTSLWSEKLPHEAIVKRAEESATTIDPSEGNGQLEVFLSKIGEALRGDGGNATLHSGSQADSLELTTSTKLPAPLKPLKWTISLLKEPPSAFTSRLLLPLLRDETSWESRQRTLLDQLKQKDWVLGKLFDKAEALQIDLGTVFPAAAGLRSARKGSTRSEAARFIKGVAPFDEQAWLAEFGSSSSATPGIAVNIAHELLGSNNSRGLDELRPPQNKWWNALQRRPEISCPQEYEPEVQSVSQKDVPVRSSQLDLDLDGDATAESEDDEFQRQATPPQLKTHEAKSAISPPGPKTKKKSPSPPPPESRADEATASESEPDLDCEPEPAPRDKRTPDISSPSKHTTPPPQKPKVPPKKAKGGLGIIGGRKKKGEEPDPQHPASPPKPAQTSEPPQPLPPQTKRPTKLGMIGGKRKDKTSGPNETSSAQPGPFRSPHRARPTSTMDRDDGPKSPETASAQKQPQKEASPRAEASAAPEVTPMTEAERADRKREELKRQLAEQSQAPTKKKRRF